MKFLRHEKSEGAGKAGCPWHPQSVHRKLHTVDHRYPETPGSPCAMVLRLISRSPRRRIRLVTVASGLMVCPPGWARKTSASLTPATGARTTRLCRTQRPQENTFDGPCAIRRAPPEAFQRRSSARTSIAHRQNPPCDAVSRPTLPRPPHPVPRSWRSRYAPLSGTGPERYIADLGSRSSIISVNRNFGLTKLNGYEPTLAAATKNLGDRVEIRIRDNGGGIPAEVMDKIFNPFITTKPPGEGTGLGLSLSHDIVVKQHAGSIEVDTGPGEFTEIKVILPRIAATGKAGADK